MPGESPHRNGVIVDHTKPPFLRRVRIRGYKSIEFCDVPLQPLTILVGRNAAGKSNFLDALSFLSDLMDSRATEAVNKRRGWRAIRCQGDQNEDIDIEVEVEFSSGYNQWTAWYGFSIGMNSDNQIRIWEEHLTLSDQVREIGYHTTDGTTRWSGIENFRSEPSLFTTLDGESTSDEKLENPQLFKRRRYDRLLLSVIGTQPFIDLAEKLRASCIYNFSPDEIRQHQPMSASTMLDPRGSNLARTIETLQKSKPNDLERVKSYLQAIVPDVVDFRKVDYGDSETIRFWMNANPDQISREFDASSMSDGTLRVLAALVAAFQITVPTGYPGFIGIEEPETALHPAAMRALVDALDETTQRTQILLTSHSADLLSGRDIVPGQVLVVRSFNGKTRITPLDNASREIVDQELNTLADLQRMDQLDLDEVDLRRQDALREEGN